MAYDGDESIDCAINMNTTIMRLVRGKWEMIAFHYGLSQLNPGSRIQIVEFKDDKEIKGAEALVEKGVFKRHGKSNTKFIVPKSVAFASLVPSWEAINNDK